MVERDIPFEPLRDEKTIRREGNSQYTEPVPLTDARQNFKSAESANVGLRILRSLGRIRFSSGNTDENVVSTRGSSVSTVRGFPSASDPRSLPPPSIMQVESLLAIPDKTRFVIGKEGMGLPG